MLGLRFPEWAGGRYFRDYLAGPEAGGVNVGHGVFGDAFLLVIQVKSAER